MRHANRKPVDGGGACRGRHRADTTSAASDERWGVWTVLPGIAGRNPTTGGVKSVGVHERGVDLGKAGNGGQPEFISRHCGVRPEQPFDCACDHVHACRLIERGGGDAGSNEVEQNVARQQRKARHIVAGQQLSQPMIGMAGVEEGRLDSSELEGFLEAGPRLLETARKLAWLLREGITVETIYADG